MMTMDGYVRVSRRLGRKGAGYISPTVQQEAIQRWADYRGVTIAQWHVDEDESGGTQDRPGLDAARDRALGGETGGIVSWKIDRFSRFTEGGLRDLRLLESEGARLAFVTEDIDTSGPMGKLVYTMLLAFAEFFLDNIKASWVIAKTRAVERGAHIGPTPFGYLRAEDGTLQVDPVMGPVVGEAFDVAAREGLHAAVTLLQRRAPGRTWSLFTVRRLLSTRTYLGEVNYGDLTAEEAHEPLTDPVTFARVPRLHESGRRSPPGEFPLSGVAVCGTCGTRMVGGRGGTDNRRVYRCPPTGDCPRKVAVSAEIAERVVADKVRAALAHVEGRASVERTARDAEEALERAQAALDAALRAFDGLEGERAARERLVELRERRDECEARLVHLGGHRSVVVLAGGADWDRLTPGEQRALIRITVAEVRVGVGRGAGRVSVKLVG